MLGQNQIRAHGLIWVRVGVLDMKEFENDWHFITFSPSEEPREHPGEQFHTSTPGRVPQRAFYHVFCALGYCRGHFIMFPYTLGNCGWHFIMFYLHVCCPAALKSTTCSFGWLGWASALQTVVWNLYRRCCNENMLCVTHYHLLNNIDLEVCKGNSNQPEAAVQYFTALVKVSWQPVKVLL